jgi:hypothetical protein
VQGVSGGGRPDARGGWVDDHHHRSHNSLKNTKPQEGGDQLTEEENHSSQGERPLARN